MTDITAGDRVRDTRYGSPGTVLHIDTAHRGCDGYGILIEYDDEPDVLVSTGSDYFERIGGPHAEEAS